MADIRKDTYYIYALVCPLEDEPYYVGRTRKLNERYRMHCKDTEGNSEKHRRTKRIRAAGLEPRLAILEAIECEMGCAIDSGAPHSIKEAEYEWIHRLLDAGHPLTNQLSKTPEKSILEDAIALGEQLKLELGEEGGV